MGAQMTISLPPAMVAQVRDAVGAGDYSSISEVLREAIRDWTRKRAAQSMELSPRPRMADVHAA
jgi:antitoxin ParD1/3/4